ncbi:MAG TPA: M20/M25/M40 family metallo-hydrolase [Gemmatimonadales bacterium]|nr:M20/M25/M40 family metallo-hydrolase [Gemmatimonadales bacterium]
MASTWPTEITTLRELVAIPSISGNERPAAEYVEQVARGLGLDVVRDDTSVRVSVGDESAGPTLALASHLDVVPPGEGWTRDPFTPVIEGDLLYGRGSGDAKASVVAMLHALGDVAAARRAWRGRALAIFAYGEETRNATMPMAVERAGRLDAAIVGEPTNLEFAVAQRGLMMVDLVAHGDQRHAGYAATEGFTNAISLLARNIARLDGIADARVHPVLGVTTVTPTMLQGGVSRNVTPPTARAVLDIRSTPDWTHDELAALLMERLDCEVVVTSTRLVPCETPAGSPLLAAAQRAHPAGASYGSPTCSDWCFLRHLDAIKVGPGTSRRSHTPDESVNLSEVIAARGFYARVIEEYFA